MPNANTFLSPAECHQVEAAIRDAEQLTSAEIVAVVATESGRYDRAESIAGLMGAVLGLIVLHAVQASLQEPGSWAVQDTASISWQVMVVVLGFVLGSLLASYWHPFRRLLVLGREIEQEVNHAARAVFTAQRLHATRDAGGVLLYVSLFERRVVVLVDDGVLAKAGPEFPTRMRDVAIQHLHTGNRLSPFVESVKAAASELSELLPRQGDDIEELPNHLVRIHPRP